MKSLTRYRITVEDEAHLSEVASGRVTLPAALGIAFAMLAIAVLFAGTLLAFTPLRQFLPGYLKEKQRAATEDGLLRLDSLMYAYDRNQAYLDNIIKVMDTERTPSDSTDVTPVSRELSSDSLLTASPSEQRFISQMEEREKFNISVLAPLAADGLMFSTVCSDGVFTESSRTEKEGVVLIPRDSSVLSASDGTVIALYYSASERGYVIVVQHGRGFLTTYTHVGAPLVGPGDIVNAGQAIALAPGPDSKGSRWFSVNIWHNGSAVVPYDYLVPTSSGRSPATPYEAPRGK